MIQESGFTSSEKAREDGNGNRHSNFFNDTYGRDQTLRGHALRTENHGDGCTDEEKEILQQNYIFCISRSRGLVLNYHIGKHSIFQEQGCGGRVFVLLRTQELGRPSQHLF